jgi:hypothetical protein
VLLPPHRIFNHARRRISVVGVYGLIEDQIIGGEVQPPMYPTNAYIVYKVSDRWFTFIERLRIKGALNKTGLRNRWCVATVKREAKRESADYYGVICW